MQKGFTEPDRVLKWEKSLYGLKQSPHNFFVHLKEKLEAVGLKSQSQVDPCLFMSDKVIVLVYVNDTSPKREWINKVMQKIKKQHLELKIEDRVTGFLCVHIN